MWTFTFSLADKSAEFFAPLEKGTQRAQLKSCATWPMGSIASFMNGRFDLIPAGPPSGWDFFCPVISAPQKNATGIPMALVVRSDCSGLRPIVRSTVADVGSAH